jgi:hypothetical protein
MIHASDDTLDGLVAMLDLTHVVFHRRDDGVTKRNRPALYAVSRKRAIRLGRKRGRKQ